MCGVVMVCMNGARDGCICIVLDQNVQLSCVE